MKHLVFRNVAYEYTLTSMFLSGKFEMHVFPQVGHGVHEDSPDKVGGGFVMTMVAVVHVHMCTGLHEDQLKAFVVLQVADVLSRFLVRNKFAQPKGNYTKSLPAC